MTDHASTGDPVPLSAPFYGASFPIAFKRYWRKYATFTGRASRSEYWWWALVSGVVGLILESIYVPSLLAARSGGHGIHMNAGIILFTVLGGLWALATIVPPLAMGWRRMHDADVSGLFLLPGLIPVVGWIFVLVLTLRPSNPAGTRFDKPADSGLAATWP
jgi:uncharacterized membrane protein YhaH (DUF805 family)